MDFYLSKGWVKKKEEAGEILCLGVKKVFQQPISSLGPWAGEGFLLLGACWKGPLEESGVWTAPEGPACFPGAWVSCDWQPLALGLMSGASLTPPSVWLQSGSQCGSVCGAKVEIKSCFWGDLCMPFSRHPLPLVSLPSPPQLPT